MRRAWYLHRLRRMSVGEIAGRVAVAARQRYWKAPSSRPDGLQSLLPGVRSATIRLPRDHAPDPASPAGVAVIAAADALLAGRWPLFHLPHADVGAVPDWFRDPLTGHASTPETYAFSVRYRSEAAVGNVKFVWEMSRHQATTVLASAWWLTGDERYARRVHQHLTSWWAQNPFLQGVHWTSGIEVGIRLLSWTWIRALLADWQGVGALFDENDTFVRQLYHHLRYLRTLHSRGSSANNHLVAELAGMSAACAAFPWFAETADWTKWARVALADAARAQTHDDGFNREQASEYHLFVFELLAAAALATRLAGQDPATVIEGVMRRMVDALAASLDATGRPPRFGDGDEGRGVLLDAPATDGVTVALDVGGALFGPAPWWRPAAATVLGHAARFAAASAPALRPIARPDMFAGTGMTLLRTGEGHDEIYVRCDAGPHGYRSIAAHGHADALSVEVRQGGVDILADPGTYCYHGEPEWRRYFKSTLGHNTLCVDGADQARNAGPFLWLDQPRSELRSVYCNGPVRSWHASHDGYARLPDKVTHHRRVELDPARRAVEFEDWLEAAESHDVALAFHLGPAIEAEIEGPVVRLHWSGGQAMMFLPPMLQWNAHRGETSPPLGWYSSGFGDKTPATALVGRGRLAPDVRLLTQLEFLSPAEANRACKTFHAAF